MNTQEKLDQIYKTLEKMFEYIDHLDVNNSKFYELELEMVSLRTLFPPRVEITVAMVKELRDKTGEGMISCNKALNFTNGDMALAVQYLRMSGNV